MRDLIDRIEQWRFSRQNGVGRSIWPKLLIIVGVLLFSAGFSRVAFSLKHRLELTAEVTSLSATVSQMEDAVFIRVQAKEAASESLLVRAIPHGGVPGPILEELFAVLESAGIRDFEYRIRERLETDDSDSEDDWDDEDEWGDNDDESEDFFEDDDDAEGDENLWNDEDWGIGSDVGDDDGDDPEAENAAPETTPGLSLYHWKIELTLKTQYDRTVEFLGALEEMPRHWRTSELELSRSGRLLDVVLLLETFTRPIEEDIDGVELGPLAFNNPFLGTRHGAKGGIVPTAPTLRAIMSGTAPRAWLDGQIVTTGNSVAEWTVEEIDDDGVWIRHTTGHRVRLSVGG